MITLTESHVDDIKIDRSKVATFSFSESDDERTKYWWSRTPLERLAHIQLLRELNYGHDEANKGLQRVLTVRELRGR
jgi:hypothetical protein